MSGSSSSVPAADAETPVTLTVHSLPRPAVEAAAQRGGRLRMLLVLAVCAAPVVGSYFAYYFYRPMATTNYATLVEPQRPWPAALPLADLDGRAVDAATLRGQWLLVVVGSGACDAACEQRLWLVRQLREATGRDRDRVTKLWLVHDAAQPRAELRSALAAGVPTIVLRVPASALAAWLEPEPGRALDDHVYLVDPLGNWMMRAPADPDPSRLKRDLDRLLRASASWQPNRR